MKTALVFAVWMVTVAGVRVHWPEGSLRGYPVVRDASGKSIGVATVTQNVVGKGVVRMVVDTHYADGRRIEERMSFRQQQELVQLDWSVEERKNDAVTRKFSVDMTTGHATYLDDEGNAHEETLAHTAGAFAGGGVMFAAKNSIAELTRGERVELPFVAFTPSPHVVKVALSRASTEKLAIGGRTLDADKIVVHPEVPEVAKLFVKAPDTVLWFSHSSPPAILRADTTMIEPSDPAIRIELLGAP